MKNKTCKLIPLALLLATFLLVTLAQAKKEQKQMTIGEQFHKQTSMTWRGALGDVFKRKTKQPQQYKTYPGAEKIKLPQPEYRGLTVEEAIEKRRSVRNYSKKPIIKDQLSQLLFTAQGITGKSFAKPLRTAPSAGALYPFEIYIVVNNIKDLPQGIYHYSVLDHSLELIKAGDFRSKITEAGLSQEMLGDAGATFILSAIFDRIRFKYGERGFRYVYIEAGHISQNIFLQATSLGLGSVCVGAFLDDKVNELIEIDGLTEAAVYLHAVGSI